MKVVQCGECIYELPDTNDPYELHRILRRTIGESYNIVEVHPLPAMRAMTVSDLRAALLQYPGDMRVLLEDTVNAWWVTVSEVIGPTLDPDDGWTDAESGYSLPTLMVGEDFDSRSL